MGSAGSAWRCLSSLHCNSETRCCPLPGAVSLVLTAPKWIRRSHGPCVLSTASPPPSHGAAMQCDVQELAQHWPPGVRLEPRAPSCQPQRHHDSCPREDSQCQLPCGKLHTASGALLGFFFFFQRVFCGASSECKRRSVV